VGSSGDCQAQVETAKAQVETAGSSRDCQGSSGDCQWATPGRPFKLKKEYPSEQWQIISFRLIPLKTPVSFHWTVPLICFFLDVRAPSLFSSVA
jgi:hypothetical protein